MPTPAARQSLTWTACLTAGYAGVLLAAEVAVADAGVAREVWGRRFWIRFGVAVLVSLCLQPLFLRLARRPGFLDGYGRHLTPTLLGLTAAAMLGAETPAGLHLIAPLVGARAP